MLLPRLQPVKLLAERALPLLWIAIFFVCQMAWVRTTNFTGVDEWVYLSLASDGIISFPHSNRPLTLLWTLPAALLTPHQFLGYHLVHAAWMLLTAWVTYALALRLAPGDRPLALTAAAFAATWAPGDMVRLATVQGSMNSGVTFATFLALLLFMEAVRRRSYPVLALAALVALAAARSYEAGLGLLLGAPLLLVGQTVRDRRTVAIVAAWEVVIVAALAEAARPLLGGGATYQGDVMGHDLHPVRYALRIAGQLGLHLAPLVPRRPGVLLHAGVLLAAGMGLAGVLLQTRRADAATPRARLLVLAALGLALAVLGLAVLAVTPNVGGASRMQFLSGPGVALMLASALHLATATWARPVRIAARSAAAAWVIGLGTAYTIDMQRAWNHITYHPAQARSLAVLIAAAPDVRPNTLVLLVEETGTWPFTMGFRHAVHHLYEGRAVGHALGSDPLLFGLRWTAKGIGTEPAAVLQRPWHMPLTFHRFDEIVLFRLSTEGAHLVEDWSRSGLPALPAGASYAPHACIVSGSPSPPWRGMLVSAAP